MERKISSILESSRGRTGHVFSLGHGVARATPPENLRRVVEMVHDQTRRRR